MTIDPKWIDHDLVNPNIGESGYLGDGDTDSIPLFGSSVSGAPQLIPESQWRERIERMSGALRALVRTVKNQGSNGSCTGAMGVDCAMIAQAYQYGTANWTDLSIMSVYKSIGRTSQSGAYIKDAIDQLSEVGALPVSTPDNQARYKHTMGDRSFSEPYPAGWKDTAAKFKILRWWKVQGIEGFVSATLQGMPVGYGRDRHAICAFLPVYRGNDLLMGYVNSWLGWGDPINDEVTHGLGYDSRRTIERCTGYAAQVAAVREEIHIPEV